MTFLRGGRGEELQVELGHEAPKRKARQEWAHGLELAVLLRAEMPDGCAAKRRQ